MDILELKKNIYFDKKLTEIQKKQIVNLFYSGHTLDDLAIEFNCT